MNHRVTFGLTISLLAVAFASPLALGQSECYELVGSDSCEDAYGDRSIYPSVSCSTCNVAHECQNRTLQVVAPANWWNVPGMYAQDGATPDPFGDTTQDFTPDVSICFSYSQCPVACVLVGGQWECDETGAVEVSNLAIDFDDLAGPPCEE